MNFEFKRGDRLVLELINSDEILEGEFVDGAKDRIVLINITSYKNHQIIKGPYSYYRSDISSVRLLNDCDTANVPDPITNVEGHNCDTILIDKQEYERLKEMSRNYLYMSTLDSRYYEAMKYIKNCESVGLSGITTSFEKTAAINLIIISTWDKVYILDFLIINTQKLKFPPELKDILECTYVKKVMHDSRLLTEILSRRYNIDLKNIFDTKIADIIIRRKKEELPQNTKNLSECLTCYFNFPTTLLAAQDTTLDKWIKRPLSDTRKFKAAQTVTFLITLKNHLETLLLEDFYKVVDGYSKSLKLYCMQEVPNKLLENKLCPFLCNINLN